MKRYCVQHIVAAVLLVLLALAVGAIATASAQQGPRALFERARILEETNQKLTEAIKLYGDVVSQAKGDRALAANALLRIGACYEKLGNAEARKAYERLVREFADQAESATTARTRLAALTRLGGPTNPSGVVVRQVWAGPGVDGNGALSPDGQFLTFIDWQTGDLALRNLATGKNRHLTNKGSWSESNEYGMQSIVSPDGKQVAYVWQKQKKTNPIKTEPLQRWDLRIISLDGLDNAKPRVVFDNEDVSSGLLTWA